MTFGRMRQRLVEMDSWSKLIFRRNVSKICLKLVEHIKDLSRKTTERKQLYFEFSRQVFGQFFIQDFCWSFLCFGGGFSYPSHRLPHFKLRHVRSMHIVACLLQYTIIRRCYIAALTFPIVTFPVTSPGFGIESVFTI